MNIQEICDKFVNHRAVYYLHDKETVVHADVIQLSLDKYVENPPRNISSLLEVIVHIRYNFKGQDYFKWVVANDLYATINDANRVILQHLEEKTARLKALIE